MPWNGPEGASWFEEPTLKFCGILWVLFRSGGRETVLSASGGDTTTAIEERIAGHLDNQFRLLREDILSDIREELQAVNEKNKKRRKRNCLWKRYSVAQKSR
jgi:hypothetical protein